MKKIIAIILAVVTILGMTAVPVNAASSLEEAMAEVDVFARNADLDWLCMNGSVKTQWYTYYNYQSPITGQTAEIPAYCVDPRLYGVPALVSEGTAIKYSADSMVSDPKVMGIVANGYPHIDLATLGLQTVEEAYYATKTALWCYLLSSWDITSLSVNPSANRAAAERVLQATKDIYTRGMRWDKLVEPKLTATPDRDVAYVATVNGESVYQQIFTVTSETWSIEPVMISLASGAPSGTKLLDMNNNEVSSLNISDATYGDDGYSWSVKVVYPSSSVEGEEGTVQLNMSSVVVQYELYFATTLEASTYGEIQEYVLDTDPHTAITGSATSTYGSDTPATTTSGETGLKITKLEKGTNTPLAGAVYEVLYPDGSSLGSFSTSSSGTITIPLTITGNYTVTELSAPTNHLLPETRTQSVTVVHGKIAEVTFIDAPYGNIRVQKISDTGEGLKGVTIQAKNIATGATQTGQTNTAGVVEFTNCAVGGWEIRELAGIEGWEADTETVQTVAVVTGETSTATIVNRELPGLRVVKYDRTSLQTLSSVTFEIFKDGTSLGQFQTDEMGEILLTNITGTIRVVELQSVDTHITAFNEQEIELKAGDGIKPLIFFNDRRPGLFLTKVDSSNLSKPLTNARFKIEAVDGSWGPQELLTGADGTIDLSGLPHLNPTAYVVTELDCPGYVIDDAQRIVWLKPNEDMEFVFTNSKLPSLHLLKVDSLGNLVEGASYRLAKIEDGSRYLDRTTSSTGEILWDGLEPGVYSLVETATRSNLILDPREYHVQLFPGKTSEIVLENHIRPNLYVYKYTTGTSDPVEGCVLTVRAADGHSVDEIRTDSTGMATLANLLPGVYEISEKSVPSAWLMDAPSQLVTLWPDRDHTAYFYDSLKPNITVQKVSSVTGDPLRAKFHVEYASGSTSTGELNDLGYYYTDAATGEFSLVQQRDGWYRISEVDVEAGYAISEPAVQEFYLAAGAGKVVTYEDMPLSAIVIWKYDSETGAAMSSCRFELKYLSGSASGTGGTVVATATTSANGTCTFTQLKKGTYIVSELESDGNHVISKAPQTVYISGEEQDVVSVYFGNVPVGGALIRKTDGEGKPLGGCSFLVTTSSGELVGDANGVYKTDASGTALIEGITPGETLIIKETQTKDSSYVLDEVARTVRIKPGRTIPVDFVNLKKGNLLLLKLSSADKQTPIANTLFELRYADGRYVDQANGKLSSNGQFYTDSEGKILVTGICGTVVATEIASAQGYSIDESTRTQTVVIRPEDTQMLRFFNTPWQLVVLQKYADDGKKTPLSGVTYLLTDGSGAPLGGGNGEYTTNSAGQILLSAPVGSTIKAREVRTVSGYALNSEIQTITVQASSGAQTVISGAASGSTSGGATVVSSGDGGGNQMTFYNKTLGKLELIKTDAANKNTRLGGAKYEIRQINQGVVTTIVTGADGRAVAELGEGDFYALEIEAPSGYRLDSTPHYFTIKDGETFTLPVTDRAISGIEIHKVSSTTGEGVYNAKFLVYDAKGNVVGELSTNDRGYARIELDAGLYRLRELECEGYVVDTKLRDVTVKSGGFALVEWENTPITGQIQVVKYAAETNSVTGQAAGTPLQGATFEIVNPRNNVVVAHITSDARGIAASGALPLGRYLVREVSSPTYWQVSAETFDVALEFAGQIIKLAAYDKPAQLGVVVTKTGVREVLAGNKMTYTFTVANTSNVALESFYVHDKIPYDVTGVSAITTGTYSQRLTYRVLYKTNVNEYRVLASNLLTTNSYAFQLSGLPLMAGEVVTDIYYDFGTVPAGFQSVAKPTLTVSVSPTAVNGYQVINRADAGGKYGGTWQSANAAWITIVRNLTPVKKVPLPKTGY